MFTAGICDGSNVIYFTTGGNNLWGYEDTLAATTLSPSAPPDKYTVGIDPVTGRADFMDLVWQSLGTDTGLVNRVDVQLAEKEIGWDGASNFFLNSVRTAGPTLMVAPVGAGGNIAYTLRANTEYVWRARASNTVSDDYVISDWTEGREFTVESGTVVNQPHAGPIMTSPAPGSSNVNPDYVGFAWAPVPGATEYQIIVATDAALSNTVGGTPATVTSTSYEVTGLETDTTYFWSVQATKPTMGVEGRASFTTRAPAIEPVVIPTQEAPTIILPQQETPGYVWAVIAVGAVLVIAVIVLIVRTGRAR
jgi:hypothetical protein